MDCAQTSFSGLALAMQRRARHGRCMPQCWGGLLPAENQDLTVHGGRQKLQNTMHVVAFEQATQQCADFATN